MTDSNFKFIIIGAGRGGTSLITALLDYHSKLEVLSEYSSISHLMGRELQCDDIKIFHQRTSVFMALCKAKARETPDKIWGNKITTEQIRSLEEHNIKNPDAQLDILDTFFKQYFKNHKKIFILRDGRSCVNSKVKRTGQPMRTACEKWSYSVSVYKYLQACDNSLSIRFEDLLFLPDATLQKVCQFLEISYEPDMLKGVANKRLMPEYQNTQLMTEKTRTIELPDEYLALIKDDLAYCNYI